jgi:hypothetical protein
VKSDKEKIEVDFTKWLNGNGATKAKYAETLKSIQDYYNEWDPYVKASTYSSLCGIGGAEFMGFAAEMGETIKQILAETDEAKRKEGLASLQGDIDAFFKEYDATTDRVVFVNLTNLYRERMPSDRPSWHATLDSKYKGSVSAFSNKLFETSIFVDKARLMAFLQKPSAKVIDKDLAYIAASSASAHAMNFRSLNPQQKFNKGMRQFVAGLREMNPNKAYAPDANSTMRVTYGVVDDYKAADAVHYDFYTTAAGIMEKRDNSNPEFVVPDKLAELITKKDFGRYANSKGELPTCFIHNLDITGGNSGSPVIDGDGNIVGIAFDGNWEAMSGDIAFEPELQRTISVDIRYVLFIVDKLMGGKNIVDELKYVKKQPKVEPAPVVPAAPVVEPAPAKTEIKKASDVKKTAKPAAQEPKKK